MATKKREAGGTPYIRKFEGKEHTYAGFSSSEKKKAVSYAKAVRRGGKKARIYKDKSHYNVFERKAK